MLSAAARKANTLYRQRKLAEAVQAFARVVEREPQHGEVRRLYGLALRDAGHPEAAVEQLKTAVVLDRSPDSMRQLGETLRRAGRLEEAAQCMESLLVREPDNAENWCVLAQIRLDQNEDDDAAACVNEALRRAPEDVRALTLFGTAGRRLGYAKAAAAALTKAAALVPKDHDALCNLATALCQADMEEDAIPLYDAALRLRPASLPALGNRGAALTSLGRPQEALPLLERAERADPGNVAVLSLLVSAHRNAGNVDKAIEYCQAVLRAAPTHKTARANWATLLGDQGRHAEELEVLRAIRADHPDDPSLARFESLLLLLHGRFEEGWALGEARLRIGQSGRQAEALAPRWTGQDLAGKRVALTAEEGFGDTLHMIRYAGVLAERGATVGVRAPANLHRVLLQATGVSETILEGDSTTRFDYEIPMLSLPYSFGTRLDNIPARVPYLAIDAVHAARWRRHVAALAGERPCVGLVWSGNPKHGNDHNRSMRWAEMAPVTGVAGIAFFSLQVGRAEADLRADPRGVIDLAPRLTDYHETAGAVGAMDLVITVDTSVAHLTGAMGKTAWLLLPRTPDWRWLLNRDDSPWYPTMRLFRQPELRSWPNVISQLLPRLETLRDNQVRHG